MNIFISCSSLDYEIYTNLANVLRIQGHSVTSSIDINMETPIIEKVKNAIYKSNIFIAVITESFLHSPWAQAELSSISFSLNP